MFCPDKQNEQQNAISKNVESLSLFFDKAANLEFGEDARLSDNQQVALDCYYGILYNPYVACTAAESFLDDAGGVEQRCWGLGIILQASLLHPMHLNIDHALAVPFDEAYSRYVYCLGRLLGHAVSPRFRQSRDCESEILSLLEHVKDFDAAVFEAFVKRDGEKLDGLKSEKLRNPEHLYDFAWWSRFFSVRMPILSR